MSIQINDNASVMAQILQDNAQSRVAQQSEPEIVPVTSVSSVDEITQGAVSAPQVDTVEISAEGQAAVARMYERMASRAAAAENPSESEGQAQAAAPAQEQTSGKSVEKSNKGGNAPMQISLKVSEPKKEATTTTSAPIQSSSDDESVNINKLYQYTEAQLAKFLRKGLISRAQYDSEIARRNGASSSAPKTDTTGLGE